MISLGTATFRSRSRSLISWLNYTAHPCDYTAHLCHYTAPLCVTAAVKKQWWVIKATVFIPFQRLGNLVNLEVTVNHLVLATITFCSFPIWLFMAENCLHICIPTVLRLLAVHAQPKHEETFSWQDKSVNLLQLVKQHFLLIKSRYTTTVGKGHSSPNSPLKETHAVWMWWCCIWNRRGYC